MPRTARQGVGYTVTARYGPHPQRTTALGRHSKAVCRAARAGTLRQNSGFKSSLFCFSSRPSGPSRGREILAHLLVPGRRRGRAPHGLQTSSEEQCCPVTSLQDQPGPVTTDACKETQDAQWVETSLDTLSSELPPWESSASWAKGRLTWANIILP